MNAEGRGTPGRWQRGVAKGQWSVWRLESHNNENNAVQWVEGVCVCQLFVDLWVKTMWCIVTICMCFRGGDKTWVLQWACILVMTKPDQTKPMQYIPISAVPMNNTRGPKPHYFTEGEKESSLTEQQEVRPPEDTNSLYTRAGKSHRRTLTKLLRFS